MRLQFRIDVDDEEGREIIVLGSFKYCLVSASGFFSRCLEVEKKFESLEEFKAYREDEENFRLSEYCLFDETGRVVWAYHPGCGYEVYYHAEEVMAAEAVNQQEEVFGEEADEVIKIDDSRTFLGIVRDLEMLLFRIGNMEKSVNEDVIREHMLAIEYVLYKDYICSTKVS